MALLHLWECTGVIYSKLIAGTFLRCPKFPTMLLLWESSRSTKMIFVIVPLGCQSTQDPSYSARSDFHRYHHRHHMWRKEVPLCAEPSAIAPVAALLSRSRFPAERRLHPSDDIEEIKRKDRKSTRLNSSHI